MPSSQDALLTGLTRLGKPELHDLWRQLFRKEPPSGMRKDLLLRIITHRQQELKWGELSPASLRRLRQLASALDVNPKVLTSSRRPSIKSGTRLVRQWKNHVHVVNVEEEEYEYGGDRYQSLSEIARLITGTQWSGPLFFGLKTKQSSISTEKQ